MPFTNRLAKVVLSPTVKQELVALRGIAHGRRAAGGTCPDLTGPRRRPVGVGDCACIPTRSGTAWSDGARTLRRK